MRFGWLTAAAAAAVVAPAAQAASTTYVGSGSFDYTAGTWASVSGMMPTPGNQTVYFPVVTDRAGRPNPIELTITFSVPGEWGMTLDYQVGQWFIDIDKSYCEYCGDGILGGEQASGYGTVGQLSWWDATYRTNPKIGSAWSQYTFFPNDRYVYWEILWPHQLWINFKSNDYTGVVNWTTFARYVPEPATWALMIIGFGAIGGALRRQKAQRRHAVAQG